MQGCLGGSRPSFLHALDVVLLKIVVHEREKATTRAAEELARLKKQEAQSAETEKGSDGVKSEFAK